AFAAASSLLLFAGTGKFGSFGGESYQQIGRISMIGVIVSVGLIHVSEKKYIMVGIAMLLTLTLLLSGTRQAFLGISIAFFYSIYAGGVRLPSPKLVGKIMLLCVILLTVNSILLKVVEINEDSIKGIFRIIKFLSFDSEVLQNTLRPYLWHIATTSIADHPVFGYGFGNFIAHPMNHQFRHPHNVFIEITYELGVVGLVLFMLAFISVFIEILAHPRRTKGDPIPLIYCSIFIAYMTAMQVSGDLQTNRFIYFLGPIILSFKSLRAKAIPPDSLAVSWEDGDSPNALRAEKGFK
ncbi:MAG: O-antigen ligase family protein, partial [Pseudomonadota bacterium]